jgi:hypothetical protein
MSTASTQSTMSTLSSSSTLSSPSTRLIVLWYRFTDPSYNFLAPIALVDSPA